MGKMIFITGGARSGKSAYAVKLAESIGGKTAFIATAQAFDVEMKDRIALHKRSRPRSWRTFEEPRDIRSVLLKIKDGYAAILVDCLGLWVSNLLMDEKSDEDIARLIKSLVASVRKADVHIIIVVSNDVGGGVVPDNTLARRFRDLLGLANQAMAAEADEVIMMQCGIPIKIK